MRRFFLVCIVSILFLAGSSPALVIGHLDNLREQQGFSSTFFNGPSPLPGDDVLSMGHTLVPTDEISGEFLSGMDVFHLGLLKGSLAEEEKQALLNFVSEGKGLFVQQEHPFGEWFTPVNEVLDLFGVRAASVGNVSTDSTVVGSHVIATAPNDLLGDTLSTNGDVSSYFDVLPSGADLIAVSAASGQPTFVHVSPPGTSGSVVSNTDISFFSDPGAYQSGSPNQKIWENIWAFFGGGPTVPVELSLFGAQSSIGGVVLRWRTESEVNNVGFGVYRSTAKDRRYTKIAFVSGHGSTPVAHEYAFVDKGARLGKTYWYFLEDIDITGKKGRSELISVTFRPRSIPLKRLPVRFALYQNYPNPFNPETWIGYDLAQAAPVSITIYSARGQRVRTLSLGMQPAGSYVARDRAVYWDGRTERGELVGNGVYFYHFRAGSFAATGKMVVAK